MARGDHIFVHCTGFSHHGIDCGDGEVIHFDFTPKRKLFSCVNGDTSRIRRTSMEEFSGGKEIHVRDYASSHAADRIIERAESRVGESGYHLFSNNCEHFARWCKTGVSDSSQIDAIDEAARPFAKGVVAATLIRTLPIIPLPLRVVMSGATLGVSLGRSTVKYFQRRQSDMQNARS